MAVHFPELDFFNKALIKAFNLSEDTTEISLNFPVDGLSTIATTRFITKTEAGNFQKHVVEKFNLHVGTKIELPGGTR